MGQVMTVAAENYPLTRQYSSSSCRRTSITSSLLQPLLHDSLYM